MPQGVKMIQEKTQEAPYTIEYIIQNQDLHQYQHLNPNQYINPEMKSRIAFIGDYRACSLLAGRAIKTHRIDYDSNISSEFDLPHSDSMYECYWVKENQMLFENNTVSYVIVHDDHVKILEIRREILKQLEVDIDNEPIIQIAKIDQADGISEEQRLLKATDWEVVKQLELMLLAQTDLGKYRAALRASINSR